MHYLITLISWVLCFAGLASSYRHHMETIPAAQSNFASVAQYISSHNGLDAPHVTPINESAYDWWYFDAYSEDTETSVIVVFFNAPATGFALGGAPPTDITEAYLFVSVPGQPFLVSQNISATQSTVGYAGNSASGDWKDSGFSFKGEPDMSEYTITIDYPELAYKGELSFKSKAPGHYPCDRAKSGVTMELILNVGWSNTVPDAVSEVHLTVNGTKVDFTGVGYHDKNWGDAPLHKCSRELVLGPWRACPYSVVWYDALTPTGSEYVSVYVAKDGDIVAGSCKLTSIKVRPSGATDPYPPSLAGPSPSGNFKIHIDLGDEGTMIIDVTPSVEIVVAPGPIGEIYDKWTGKLKGGIVGKETYTGTALYEQFTLTV